MITHKKSKIKLFKFIKNTRDIAGIFLCLITCSLILSACVAPQSKQLQLERPSDLPTKAYIKNVPFYPQKQFHCGPSTLAMAMNFYGKKLSPNELAKDVFTPGRKGSFQSEMKAAVRKRGMIAYELTPELVYLLAEVSVGHPVIILQNKAVKYYPVWHYALVIGYDLEKNQIYLHSGLNKNYVVSMSVFEFTWKRSNRWAMAVLPTDTLPNDRNLINALQAAVDLEEVGQTEAANQTYQTITKRWPESFVALMGAANTHLQLKQPKQATSYYLRANKVKPTEAGVYNNMAYSLLEQECHQSALKSIDCAISLEPNNAEFQSSLNEIKPLTSRKDVNVCPVFECVK